MDGFAGILSDLTKGNELEIQIAYYGHPCQCEIDKHVVSIVWGIGSANSFGHPGIFLGYMIEKNSSYEAYQATTDNRGYDSGSQYINKTTDLVTITIPKHPFIGIMLSRK